MLGDLTRDVVAGAPPRPGGPPLYASRTLAAASANASVVVRCSPDDAAAVDAVRGFGLPVTWLQAETTTGFSFHYVGERRTMTVDAIGDPWTFEDVARSIGDAEWVQIGAVLRSDFDARALRAAAGDGRRVLLDAHGLVRVAALGPLQQDGNFDRAVLEAVSVLKLNEDEADIIVGDDLERLGALGVPEVLLTLGSKGTLVITPAGSEHVPATPAERPFDPTGAGDTFSAGYLVARADGAAPVEAARSAGALVTQLLAA